ncbi:hypothetical protein LG329_15685 [Virgibacillus necropolis]|uniref:hypothetical protein n=1 Tax=Virgibacillus necropolis TaxID=163877 RepID=UPI00384CE6EB
MSSYNPYQPNRQPYRQNEWGNGEEYGYQGYGRTETKESRTGIQAQDDTHNPGNFPEYSNPTQGQRNGQHHSSFPANSYQGASPDMRYMMQMMNNLENNIDRLNQLIAQNNQLLQSMHDQEETKCIQGGGGGAVIVRM